MIVLLKNALKCGHGYFHGVSCPLTSVAPGEAPPPPTAEGPLSQEQALWLHPLCGASPLSWPGMGNTQLTGGLLKFKITYKDSFRKK